MDTNIIHSDKQKELDDSGCVHDVSGKEPCKQHVNLLDLSDDVLLCILQYCGPYDLKALGFTCPRLGTLIQDRTLWSNVDTRAKQSGKTRLRWFIDHVLCDTTQCLKLKGYANEAKGCLGYINRPKPIKVDKEKTNKETPKNNSDASTPSQPHPSHPVRQPTQLYMRAINNLQIPRFAYCPSWPTCDEIPLDIDQTEIVNEDCRGPQFTITKDLLAKINEICNITTLHLEYCNINYNTTSLESFPPKLVDLSLKGTKCYNLPFDKSFLQKVNEFLPLLEILNISECDWVEPSALLPLSKLPALSTLKARNCKRLAEFVAYSSLATRYGLKVLKVLDMRGSPLGDSEVSAFAWLPLLEELYLAPNKSSNENITEHAHYKDEQLVAPQELDDWEIDEPDYFSSKRSTTPEPESEQPQEPTTDEFTSTKIVTISLNPNRAPRVENLIIPRYLNDEVINGLSRNDAENQAVKNQAAVNTRRRRIEDDDDSVPAKRQCNVNVGASGSESGRNCAKVSEMDGVCESDNANSSIGDSSKAGSSKDEYSEMNVDNVDNDEENANKAIKVVNASDIINANISENQVDNAGYVANANNIENQVNNANDLENGNNVENDANNVENPANVENNPDNPAENGEPNPNPQGQVLYVNVHRQLHAVYRLAMENDREACREVPENLNPRMRVPFLRNIFYAPASPEVDPSTLVSDIAIRRFGRSDTERINYVQFGPNGAFLANRLADSFGRPDKSKLKKLVCTGFQKITNASLMHLVSAAPDLCFVDFSNTNVTESGVEDFKLVRPDVEVVFSTFK